MPLRLVLTGLAALAILGIAGASPAVSRWLPACPLLSATGLYCAGCGATRAAHALLHGDFVGAVAFNPLLVVALPGIVSVIAAGRTRPSRGLPPWAGFTLLAVLLAYSVFRNVPGFEWLGPPR